MTSQVLPCATSSLDTTLRNLGLDPSSALLLCQNFSDGPFRYILSSMLSTRITHRLRFDSIALERFACLGFADASFLAARLLLPITVLLNELDFLLLLL